MEAYQGKQARAVRTTSRRGEYTLENTTPATRTRSRGEGTYATEERVGLGLSTPVRHRTLVRNRTLVRSYFILSMLLFFFALCETKEPFAKNEFVLVLVPHPCAKLRHCA